MRKILTFLSVFLRIALAQQGSSNLICNGDFQGYPLSSNGASLFLSNYSCWYNLNGGQIEVQQPSNPFITAILELANSMPYILCQDVAVQVGYLYQLSFTVYNSKKVRRSTILVKINGTSTFNHTTPTSYTLSYASAIIGAISNVTQICFDAVYSTSPYSLSVALCLDNISLALIGPIPNTPIASSNLMNLTNITNVNFQLNTTLNSTFSSGITSELALSNATGKKFDFIQFAVYGTSTLISFPVKLIVSLRCAYLILDDVWLYDYAEKNYTGLIEVIFETITTVQLLKFQYLEKYLGWNQYKAYLGMSNYAGFTVPKFVQLEEASSVLADSNFAFLVYSVPQKLAVCLALYLLFRLLYNYRVSKYIRKFYFLKTCLAITLLEENLAYFVFVCFLNMTHPFSSTIVDRLCMTFTVVFMFFMILFALSFFPLVLKYLRKRASYFADFTLRNSAGFWYRSVRQIRNLLRAVAFCFFHYQFRSQLLMLSVVELLSFLVLIFSELLHRVFRSKMMFSCHLLYGFLFFLINLTILADDFFQSEDQILELLSQGRSVILYSLIVCVIMIMLLGIFVYEKQRQTLQQIEKNPSSKNTKQLSQRKKYKRNKIILYKMQLKQKEKSIPHLKNEEAKRLDTNLPEFDEEEGRELKLVKIPVKSSINVASRIK